MIENDKAKELSSKLSDNFRSVDKDGGSTQELILSNGGLVEQTWWEDEEIKQFLEWAKESRQIERVRPTTGALQNHFCELPAVVYNWIINKYKLHNYLDTKEAKRKIFEAVENDVIIPIGNNSKRLPLKLFKHTNLKLGKDKPSNF